jgi:hypothetical protein
MREPSHTSPEADDIGEDRERCDVDRQHDHPSVRATRLARRAPVVKSASRALDGDQGRGAGGQRFLELLFDPLSTRCLANSASSAPAPATEDRLIASEPFSDLPGVWHEIDESSAVIVRSGGVLEHEPFRPQVPRATLSSS